MEKQLDPALLKATAQLEPDDLKLATVTQSDITKAIIYANHREAYGQTHISVEGIAAIGEATGAKTVLRLLGLWKDKL